MEKPITLVSEEARKLAELAAKQRRILQVGHIFRFDPASQWLRDAIQAGHFGRVQILRSNFSGFKRPRNDSGVMFADAIHFVDLFNYFMGKTPARVFAATQDFLGRGMEDASLLSLEYPADRGVAWAHRGDELLSARQVPRGDGHRQRTQRGVRLQRRRNTRSRPLPTATSKRATNSRPSKARCTRWKARPKNRYWPSCAPLSIPSRPAKRRGPTAGPG